MAFKGPPHLLPPVGEEGPSFPSLKKSLYAVSSQRSRSRSPRPARGISAEPLKENDLNGGSNDTTRSGKKDPSLFVDIPTMPRAAEVALTALKYLPIPLLVLSSSKMVLLANEAMGRLLDLDSMDEDGNEPNNEDHERAQSLDLLRGQTISQIGIDLYEDGQAIWVSWEVCHSFQTENTGEKPTDKWYRNFLISLRTSTILLPTRRAKKMTKVPP